MHRAAKIDHLGWGADSRCRRPAAHTSPRQQGHRREPRLHPGALLRHMADPDIGWPMSGAEVAERPTPAPGRRTRGHRLGPGGAPGRDQVEVRGDVIIRRCAKSSSEPALNAAQSPIRGFRLSRLRLGCTRASAASKSLSMPEVHAARFRCMARFMSKAAVAQRLLVTWLGPAKSAVDVALQPASRPDMISDQAPVCRGSRSPARRCSRTRRRRRAALRRGRWRTLS